VAVAPVLAVDRRQVRRNREVILMAAKRPEDVLVGGDQKQKP